MNEQVRCQDRAVAHRRNHVDFGSAKHYYMLREAEGRPLSTTGVSTLKAGPRARAFMQFPAMGHDRGRLQLPLFGTAQVRISG